MRAIKIILLVIIGLVGVAALGLILGLAVQLLWNWLMPAVFGLPVITYWQAVGLFVLSHLLFGKHHGIHRKESKRHPGHKFARKVHTAVFGEESEAGTAEAIPAG